MKENPKNHPNTQDHRPEAGFEVRAAHVMRTYERALGRIPEGIARKSSRVPQAQASG